MQKGCFLFGLICALVPLCITSSICAYPSTITVINTAPLDYTAYVMDLRTESQPFVRIQSNALASVTGGKYSEIRMIGSKFSGGKKLIPYTFTFPEESMDEVVVLFSGHDFVTIKRLEPSAIGYTKVRGAPASTMQH